LFQWQASVQVLTINSTTYSLAGVRQLEVAGGLGNDRLIVDGSSAAETVRLSPGSGQLSGGGARLAASSFENITVVGGASDRAVLFDSAGDDRLTAAPAYLSLSGAGFQVEVRGFGQHLILGTAGGSDSATLYGSAARDELDASSRFVWLRGGGQNVRLEGFESMRVFATPGGGDVARFWGSDGNDVLGVWSQNRDFYSGGVSVITTGFGQAAFVGGGGWDTVDYSTTARGARLYGRAHYGAIVDRAFETQFSEVEAVLARVRSAHKFKADLAALEFYFQRIGRR
jgi:hypothetical protein